MNKKANIFTLQFWLLCASSFLFFSSFNMLIPELPSYLSKMGGGEYKGLIISLFTVTAGLSRPFSGKLTDKIGRVPVMAVGSIICFVCGFLYPLATTVFPFLILRLVHGFSTGFKPTATAAYIADIVPISRRGESMGMHGLVGGLGMAFGPFLGSEITLRFGINTLFYTSSAFALLSILIIYNMKETLADKVDFKMEHLKLKKNEIFDASVMPVVIVIFFTSFSYGALITLVPDLSQHIGLKNKGTFFLIYTLASILVRIVAGKMSDKKGRAEVLVFGSVILVLAMVLISIHTFEKNSLFVSAILFGISMGILSPILQAWTIDLCEDKNRGKALATMYIALETGIGLGAFLPSLIYKDKIQNLPMSFFFTTIVVIIPLIYLLFFYKEKRTTT